jgi:hypothetical protein
MLSRRLLLRTIVTGLCATAAVAIVVLLSRSFDWLTGRILLTTTAISVCALLVVPAGALLDRDRRALLARSSALVTLGSFVLSVFLIWIDDRPVWLWKTWAVIGTLTLTAAQGCAVESRRRDSDSPLVNRLVTGSAVSGGILTGLGVLAILAEIQDGGFYRLPARSRSSTCSVSSWSRCSAAPPGRSAERIASGSTAGSSRAQAATSRRRRRTRSARRSAGVRRFAGSSAPRWLIG